MATLSHWQELVVKLFPDSAHFLSESDDHTRFSFSIRHERGLSIFKESETALRQACGPEAKIYYEKSSGNKLTATGRVTVDIVEVTVSEATPPVNSGS